MGKYVYIYFTGKHDADAGNDEEWGKWFGELGDKIIDPGNQFRHGGQAVHVGGVMDVMGEPATGYTIVKADSMAEATELAKGCPLASREGMAVCVYEAIPM